MDSAQLLDLVRQRNQIIVAQTEYFETLEIAYFNWQHTKVIIGEIQYA